jgi:hypothetical protein
MGVHGAVVKWLVTDNDRQGLEGLLARHGCASGLGGGGRAGDGMPSLTLKLNVVT